MVENKNENNVSLCEKLIPSNSTWVEVNGSYFDPLLLVYPG